MEDNEYTMKKLKVMTIVGTRPEIIKLSRIMALLEQHTHHVLVHTGQNYDYELNEIFFNELNIKKPDYYLNIAGEHAANTIGQVIIEVDQLLRIEKPEAVLIYGDTNSGLAVIAAKRQKIPIFHMEAGNRCFDERVPEEINRKIIDHISDVNMTISEHAKQYLLKEGLAPETTIKIGSSMSEVYDHYLSSIQNSPILDELKLSPKQYFLVSAHREENVDVEENLLDLLHTVNAIATRYKKKIIFSTHPRTRLRLNTLLNDHELKLNAHVEFLKPFGFIDYIKLQLEAYCVLSDSGSLTEEASILDFPAVMIRNTHERPEGMEVGALCMCGLKATRVMQAIDIVIARQRKNGRFAAMVPDYAVDQVSNKVLNIILSYVDYVNDNVWKKKNGITEHPDYKDSLHISPLKENSYEKA